MRMCVDALSTNARARRARRSGRARWSAARRSRISSDRVANVSSFGWDRRARRARPRARRLPRRHRRASPRRSESFSRDDSIDAIWCIRGGYGAMRLLDGIDYDALARRPKAIIGYSDITALHAAVGPRCDLVTYHGPTARAQLTDYTRASLARRRRRAHGARSRSSQPSDDAAAARGTARGRLAGGNLALVAALAGTPYAPDLDGAILVLEDVNEAVYRIDRMFTQLWLSGALDRHRRHRVRQLHRDSRRPGERDSARSSACCRRSPTVAGCPASPAFPMGHIDDQCTFPLGATATLDADRRMLVDRALEFTDNQPSDR